MNSSCLLSPIYHIKSLLSFLFRTREYIKLWSNKHISSNNSVPHFIYIFSVYHNSLLLSLINRPPSSTGSPPTNRPDICCLATPPPIRTQRPLFLSAVEPALHANIRTLWIAQNPSNYSTTLKVQHQTLTPSPVTSVNK